MTLSYKTPEEQLFEYFIKSIKGDDLFDKKMNCWIRPDDECYESRKFNEEKAKKLFQEIKTFYNSL